MDIDQLKGYALEYFQLVKTVPLLVENVMSFCTDANIRSVLGENYREESEHISLWAKFADSIGIKKDELLDHVAFGMTNDAVRVLTDLTKISLGSGAAAMYAYEKQLPDISRSKIDGLMNFYGIDCREEIEYFTVHKYVDVKHAAAWQGIIEGVSDEPESLIKFATDSLHAQNRLLDSVCERYISPSIPFS